MQSFTHERLRCKGECMPSQIDVLRAVASGQAVACGTTHDGRQLYEFCYARVTYRESEILANRRCPGPDGVEIIASFPQIALMQEIHARTDQFGKVFSEGWGEVDRYD